MKGVFSMDERTFETLMVDVMDMLSENDDFPEFEGNHSQSFVSVGMLTYNKGMVVRLKDGSEFQVTIVQSR
jgi:hypothetical protein